MPFLSLPSSRTQTDRSRDAGGLWAAKGRSTVCCVSALTGLIRKTLQTATDTAGEGRADAAGDKTRQRPPAPPLLLSGFLICLLTWSAITADLCAGV